MQQTEKLQIKECLAAFVKKQPSAKAASNSLTNISAATISQVLNNNWELISDEMWRNIANQTGLNTQGWETAHTSVYKKVSAYFGDAKKNPNGIHSLIINSSLGKSTAVGAFCNMHTSSYHIRCHRFMSIRVLLRDMLKAMGKDSSGTTIDMLDNLVNYLQRDNQPLFIIDEVDKLRDEVLEMFVDIENKLYSRCGFVFLATPFLKKRIEQGVSRGKRGFAELHSRMKKIFWDLTPSKTEFKHDVKAICQANGVNDDAVTAEFVNKCDGDFRVLTDLINAQKTKQ